MCIMVCHTRYSGDLKHPHPRVGTSRNMLGAGSGFASLLKTEGGSSAELDGSSLPPLVVEGKILVL